MIRKIARQMASFYIDLAEMDDVTIEEAIENYPYGDWLNKYSELETQEEWNDCMDLCDNILETEL